MGSANGGARAEGVVVAISRAQRQRSRSGDVPGWQLTLVKLLVVLLPVGMALTGVRSVFWPIVSWHMYSSSSYRVPGPVVTDTVVRITTSGGRTHVLRASDLMPDGREKGVRPLLGSAFGPEADRVACAELAAIVERVVGEPIASMERVEHRWHDVNPWTSPLLDPDRPDGATTTGTAPCVGSGPR